MLIYLLSQCMLPFHQNKHGQFGLIIINVHKSH